MILVLPRDHTASSSVDCRRSFVLWTPGKQKSSEIDSLEAGGFQPTDLAARMVNVRRLDLREAHAVWSIPCAFLS